MRAMIERLKTLASNLSRESTTETNTARAVMLGNGATDLSALLSWAQDAARGLDAAECQFREYARQHRAKEPPQIGKAETNDRMADALAALLARWNASPNAAEEEGR